MTLSYSQLAKKVPGVRPLTDASYRDPWGLLVHTTGGGVTALAKKRKERPIDVAIRTYIASQNGSNTMPNGKPYFWGGPSYVCDHDGSLYQLAPEEVLTNHCGGGNREFYRDGTWTKKANPAAVAKWCAQWGPKYDDPYDLFPAKSPNVNFVGVEMIPVGDGFGEAMAPGLRFTKHQHDTIVDLARDIGGRHGWPAGWWRTSRFLGHEDVDILNRMDKGGGWDPGFLRSVPYFDFTYVRNHIT